MNHPPQVIQELQDLVAFTIRKNSIKTLKKLQISAVISKVILKNIYLSGNKVDESIKTGCSRGAKALFSLMGGAGWVKINITLEPPSSPVPGGAA